ncbi:MAG: cytochrome c [Pseudomonadota bacterium]|nr:cytochrome c [Pseudomonadota bacterium]
MNPTRNLLAIGMVALMGNTSASADDAKEEAVEYRKSVYEVIAWNFGPMVGMVKQEIPFDAEVFARNAKRMAVMAPMVAEGFIPDSITDDSTAKPEIWERWDEFQAGLDKLTEESAKLSALASQGAPLPALGQQVGAVGQTCKGCHDEFRKE